LKASLSAAKNVKDCDVVNSIKESREATYKYGTLPRRSLTEPDIAFTHLE